MGLRKFIKRGCEEFSSFTRFEVGTSPRLVFGMKYGCGVFLLKGAYSELFSIAMFP
jgi:hypothetical protein